MKRMLIMPVMLMMAFAVTACTGCTANPFKAAEGVDEQAYAVLGTYQVFQKQALKVLEAFQVAAKARRGG